MSSDRPAALGGRPAFPEGLPFTRPTLPPWEQVAPAWEAIHRSGSLTKGPQLERFEERMARHLGVRHAVGLSSCTAGLLLGIQALGLQGEVIVPSFSFCATFHALRWNGLTPVFVECEEDTLTLDLRAVEAALTPRTSAVMTACLFGNPTDLEGLEALCRARGLAWFSDSAHGLGSLYRGRPLGGWGSFEVFSLSPTKLLPAAEGGVLATDDERVARWARDGRDYGNPGSYDCRFPGINGRMSELHAALAGAGLEALEGYARRRNELVDRYRRRLGHLPGLSFQRIRDGVRSSYKDFPVLVDPGAFGMGRDLLTAALQAEGIPTRPYFDPPGHRQTAYADLPARALPVTERVSSRVLCLPLASHMEEVEVERVSEAIQRIHEHGAEVGEALRGRP